MPMKNPAHPGSIVKYDCLEPMGLTITSGANALGVSRLTLSKLVNERSGISADMAIRLEKMGWSNAEHWLRMQAAYDLAQARKREKQIRVTPVKAAI